MSDPDVILLSSDDECSSPSPKKIKVDSNEGKQVLQKLTQLKEITTALCLEAPNFFKKKVTKEVEKSEITIVIADEKNHSKEIENGVVSLLDESPDDTAVLEPKDTSGDCLVLGSDSESESTVVPSQEDSENRKDPIKSENSEEVKDQVKPNGITDKKEDSVEEKESICAAPSESPPSREAEQPSSQEPPDAVENEDLLNRPSTSRASEARLLLDELLETCARSLRESRYENGVIPKYPKMKKNFDKCEALHKEAHFKRMLQDYTVSARESAPEAVVSFQRVYSYLMDHTNGDSIEVEEDDVMKLKKLERTCKKLLKRLNILENAELNFEDEEDSTFMQIDRYSRRLNQVYNKYCQILKRSPYAGRLLHEKLQFVSSRHNEINRAITKSYKTNKFPTYYDIEKCIRKCIAKHQLGLTEAEIKEEGKNCFTKMGNLLQMRRKKELYEVHCGFIALNEDPANNDDNLKIKLQESLQEGENRMKEVVEKYVKMQDSNVNVELSEDSDDSDYKESESETEEKDA